MKKTLRDYCFIIVFSTLSLALSVLPVQHYVAMARYTHYGLSIFLFGLGCVLHTIWRWSRVRPWSRAFFGSTGIFICSVGLVLYSNPWLDSRSGVPNESQIELKSLIISGYVLSALFLVLIGYLSWKDDRDHRKT